MGQRISACWFVMCHVTVNLFLLTMSRSSEAQQPSDIATASTALVVPDSFKQRDTNGDGIITEEEFIAAGGDQVSKMRRDFRVFDGDKDGRLSVNEFSRIPAFTPEDQRSAIPDPVVLLAAKQQTELANHWGEWDQDTDGSLTAAEFKAAKIAERVRGLEASEFDDWDLDKDGKISKTEIPVLLNTAFGVGVPTGELLRDKSGRVLDFRMFRNMNPDANWKVGRADYITVMGSAETAEKWFPAIKAAERFGVKEFATTGHRTDPVNQFLAMDTDLSGLLTPDELESLPPGWGPPGKNWLAGFDDDRDGAYSLYEFMLIPHVNLLTAWHAAQDLNQDGRLSLSEFRFAPLPLLGGLSAEYFRRLDLDHDNLLSLKEWPFQTTHPDAKFGNLDTDANDQLTEAEFVAEGSLPANRLKRDFKVFDADQNGRLSRTEFLSIPHWVPEHQRLGIPDPVALLSTASLSELTKHWTEWDRNGDGFLTTDEFRKAGIGRRIRGLEMTGFRDWDWDHDQKISREDVAIVLDIAFGIRTPTGDFLRTKAGSLVDWRTFQGLQPDQNGRVHRDAYIKSIGSARESQRMVSQDQ